MKQRRCAKANGIDVDLFVTADGFIRDACGGGDGGGGDNNNEIESVVDHNNAATGVGNDAVDGHGVDDTSSDGLALGSVATIVASAATAFSPLSQHVDHDNSTQLPPSASMMDHAALVSRLVYDVDTLREMQHRLLHTMLVKKIRHVLYVDRTGGGKSHSMRMLASMLKGIHLYFCPLLALMADIVLKFQEGNQQYGRIIVFNLDEMGGNANMRKRILQLLRDLKSSTTSTIFLVSSPQFMTKHKAFIDVLLHNCRVNRTLRSVMVDEAHVWAQHGSSFRYEMRQLSATFFKPLFRRGSSTPFFLACTATMNIRNTAFLSSLCAVGFPDEAKVWAEPHMFNQDYISVDIRIGSEYAKSLDETVTFLRENETGAAFVFANSKALTHSLVKSLEPKLDKLDHRPDVIHVHGSLNKDEKFGRIQLFVGAISVDGISPKVCVSTSAADVGIDHQDCRLVTILEWTSDVASFCQRRGRGSRDGRNSRTLLVAGISSYIYMCKMVHRNGEASSEDAKDDNNTTVTRHRRNNSTVYRLTDAQRAANVISQKQDILDVVNLFCTNKGCLLRRLDNYLATGKLSHTRVTGTCGGACPICSGCFRKYFRVIWKDAAVAWLDGVRDQFPLKATAHDIFDLLYKNKFWTESIFDVTVGTLNKYNIEAFLLQLIATGVLNAEKRGDQHNGFELFWVLCDEERNEGARRVKCYTIDSYWDSVCTHNETDRRQYKHDLSNV